MIAFDFERLVFRFSKFMVSFREGGKEQVIYTDDTQPWETYVNRAFHAHSFVVRALKPTPGQSVRLNEVNRGGHSPVNLSQLAGYVETGSVSTFLSNESPFHPKEPETVLGLPQRPYVAS